MKNEGIFKILVSYPLRDTHRQIFFYKEYQKYFDSIFILEDLPIIDFPKIKNLKIVKPIINGNFKERKKSRKLRILVTCGGGGRPSSKIFLNLVLKSIKKIKKYNKKIVFTLIKGAFNNKQIKYIKNIRLIDWTKDMISYFKNSDLVISEAGFFTAYELLENKLPGILVPGYRTIDNQELRAVAWEQLGCGYFVLPSAEKAKLTSIIENLIKNEKKINLLSKNCESLLKQKMKGPDVAKEILKVIR